MSNVNDNVLHAYHSTLLSYQTLESICSKYNETNTIKEYYRVLEQMKSCLINIDRLMSLERDPEPLGNIFLLKQQIITFIEKTERKMNDNKVINVQVSKRLHEDRSRNKASEKKRRVDNGDMNERKLMQIIENIEETPTISKLQDIAGLYEIKKVLKSMILLPQTQPQLFSNKQLCNTILLYGPPGTGKTRIVHALASEARAKLYCLSSGNMLSSYVGQTEETIQAVFKYLQTSKQCSILFMDEIDGLCQKRSGNEQEYSRRIKTELMSQLSKIEDCLHVYVVCATNCPWDLDTAILRRFQRRIYVPLPNHSERLEFFELFSKDTALENALDMWSMLADQTEGYSGSDLSLIIKHMLTSPITELEETKIWKYCSDGFYEPLYDPEDIDHNFICRNLSELPPNSVRARPLQTCDVLNAIGQVTPTVTKEDISRFELFTTKF